MPSSDPYVIPVIIKNLQRSFGDVLHRGDGISVLDVGCGFGKYGYLLREYLEVCYRRYKPEQWVCRIDALEAFIPHLTQLHTLLYSNVYEGTLKAVHAKLEPYDVVLAIDVIEHLEKKEGWKFLKQLKNLTRKQLYISTPANARKTNIWYGNTEYGGHKSFWPAKDFEGAECLLNDKWMTVYRYSKGASK